MSNVFTLDAIREAAEKKFGSTIIQVGEVAVELLNPVRLAKEVRAEFEKVQEELEADGADQQEILSRCLRLVAKAPHQAEALLAAIGDDLGLLVSTFEHYAGSQEAGEASASAS